ncbi:hypothetical protein B5K06_32680 [Rhizobium grahamii]|uniref:Uncharacterized protein n=1 Tax=Rhizobium grahamii TaxID=1120045 RepID=A0A370KE63_9HYPH|nr:hypothetical protein B5K06_32680 [Rhizobium grahamii]
MPDKLAAIPLGPELAEERRDDNGRGLAAASAKVRQIRNVARPYCVPQQRQPLFGEGEQAQALGTRATEAQRRQSADQPARDAAYAAEL